MKTENTPPKKGFLWHFVHVHSLWFEFFDELFSYPEMSILSYIDNVSPPTFKENMGEDFLNEASQIGVLMIVLHDGLGSVHDISACGDSCSTVSRC